MNIEIKPSIGMGTIHVPSSKSYTHRFIIASILSNKEVTLSHVTMSNDIEATLSFVKNLGYDYSYDGDNLRIKKVSKPISNTFNASESGSTLRFMIPVLMYYLDEFTIYGTEKLFKRGLSVYQDILDTSNVKYELTNNSITIKGHLKPNDYLISGDESSQYFTGLLFYLPLLKGNSSITVKGVLESAPYVDMTINTLKEFGIEIEKVNNRYLIKGNSIYQPNNIDIEGDYSNASFMDALNLLGGNVNLLGLKEDSLQGDKIYKEYFKSLKDGFTTIDLSNSIDLGPVLFMVASYFNGAHFVNIKRLRIKESDRVSDMLEELAKFGVKYEVYDNELIIHKSGLHRPLEELSSHNDHRIVMALSILLTKFGGIIKNSEAVNKSYPSFFKDLIKLGIEVKMYD